MFDKVGMKTVIPYEPLALPPLAKSIFCGLARAGVTQACIFGGAIRDAEYNRRFRATRQIKDYDIRIWLPNDAAYDANKDALIPKLEREFGPQTIMPSAGTGRPRHIFNFRSTELDVSIRPTPANAATGPLKAAAVAIDRAGDSDIALCSVALAPTLSGWCHPQYLKDRDNKTLTVFPNDDAARQAAYTARMHAKFPQHRIITLR